MSKWRFMVLAFALGMLATGLVLLYVSNPEPTEQELKFAKIRKGMTMKEVNEILSDDFGIYELSDDDEDRYRAGINCSCHEYRFEITFRDGFVTSTSFRQNRPNVLQRLLEMCFG
jgi:hypothetical protein